MGYVGPTIDNLWDSIWNPFTSLFQDIIGNGQVFFIFPIVVLTLGVHVKSRNPAFTSMFMIASGGILSGGSLFLNVPSLAFAFTVFTALGLVGLFISIIFHK